MLGQSVKARNEHQPCRRVKESTYESGKPMDRLPHPFPGACSSTHRTTRLHRRSRPRTIRPARRLSCRVLGWHKTDHHPNALRRHLRASRTHAFSFNGPKSSNRSFKRRSASRPRPAPGSRLTGTSHPCHRLNRSKNSTQWPGCPTSRGFRDVGRGATSQSPTQCPYHFRATRYGVSPLTGTIYGSTLIIPSTFCRSPLQGGLRA